MSGGSNIVLLVQESEAHSICYLQLVSPCTQPTLFPVSHFLQDELNNIPFHIKFGELIKPNAFLLHVFRKILLAGVNKIPGTNIR
jgi:hypothetical protein